MSTVERIISVPDTVEEAVSFGVAILDEHAPGWHDAIDVETVYLTDSYRCVLGQLFGDYGVGCDMLGLSDDTPDRCGFNITGQAPWQPLQDEWRRVIAERQEAAS